MAFQFSAPDMDKIRAQLAEEAQAKAGGGGGDNAMYRFWDAKVGEAVTLRLLPDGNPANTLPYLEKQAITLPFEGVVGGDHPTNKTVKIKVPCMDMYGKNLCPITQAIRPWWTKKGEAPNPMHAMAQRYYRKQSWLYQGLVVDSPIVEQNVPENPVRRLMTNFQVHQIVETTLMDPKVRNNPTDPINGRDFIVRKTKQGQYDNYTTSSWDMDSRSLSDAEMASIEKFGLFHLDKFLGRKPDAEELAVIFAMFEDSVAGRPFDVASYGKFYRPFVDQNDAAPEQTSGSTSALSYARPDAAASPAVTEGAGAAASAPASADEGAAAPQPTDIMEKIRRMREAQAK